MAENGEFLTNLTLDGVREGAYMLCKHSDDLLGHHARQVFREKAASMRAENSIYYYLKDLMKKFGSQQHASKIKKTAHGEPQQLVLEAHEFRKLVASDPAFESAIPSDQVDALFHRLECDYQKLLLHRDFVEFCLLDQDQFPMHLWFRTAAKEDGKAAISNIKYAVSSRDTELVSKGYTCLQQDINRNGTFGKHKYIWMSVVPPSTQMTNEVIDLSLTSGDLSDKNAARLWIPRHRGFKLVPGNLNEKNTKQGVLLWLRRRRALSTQDLVEPPHIDLTITSPRTRTNLHSHIDDLEAQVRKTLRRNCPIDQDCSLNFNRLYDEFDPKKVRAITKQAVLAGIETFGIKMDKKDFRLVWERINPFGTKVIHVGTFAQFLELTDFDIELSKVIQRFDVNKDGVVDYSDFLSYITGICDASARSARRIAEAADELRVWALEKQNKKLAKDGNIDSASAWRLLKPRHGRLDSETINRILRQRRKRLNAEQIYLLQVLMAPASNGEVNQAAFHAFVNHVPKKINMKSEFVTHYDSPQFLEGVKLLRDELKRCAKTPDDPVLQRIIEDITMHEQLTSENVGAYCGSIKRMFGIIDKETTGLVPANRFVETLKEMSVAVPKEDMDVLVKEFASDDDVGGDVHYLRFCEALAQKCQQNGETQPLLESPPSEILSLLKTLHQQYYEAKKRLEASGHAFDIDRAFGVEKDSTKCIFMSTDDFKDVLWAAGVHHPYLREELEAIMNCFQLHQNSGFNVALFRKFLSNGPSAFFTGNSGILDNHVERLLGELQAFLSTGKDAGARLFGLFSELDADSSGFISHDEFLQLLQKAGLRHFLSPEDEKLLLQFLDTNGDGAISYTEFVSFAKHADEKSKILIEKQPSISPFPSPTKSVKGEEASGSQTLAPASPTAGPPQKTHQLVYH
ncbi:Serine/threonine-protein phosphatase [Phytophthora nicotianae]|uniref:Serine/threonine-protein phosphatase n=1 Tax=Phytophthora nicotianae TaxID=4792 RepID=A0A0W8D480_PHYNI|nr:Serine/threonine-protein phosphatase [Phytophthora nicotianae]